MVVLVFGQGYSKLLLKIYGGERLGENDLCVNMLRLHCVYIYFLAINGITECFFNATMSQVEIEKHNYRLILFSVLFLFIAFFFAKIFNIYGFLIANCMNMSIRIGFSCFYIATFFTGYEYQNDSSVSNKHVYNVLKLLLPNPLLSLVLAISFVIIKLSESYFHNQFMHFFIGVFTFIVNMIVILKQENQLRTFIFGIFRKNKQV